jgi:broad specificity phosphatase PhoE
MTVFLVRHAKAGSRHSFDGPDELRPLSRKGRDQADALVAVLGGEPLTRILTSRYVRCRETVEPLAGKLGLEVEDHDALAEGASMAEGVALLRSLAGTSAVLCTHGDVIPTVLEAFADLDGLELPPDFRYPKGSTWKLAGDGNGRFVSAEYVAPPA